jgi:hypothetical protein
VAPCRLAALKNLNETSYRRAIVGQCGRTENVRMRKLLLMLAWLVPVPAMAQTSHSVLHHGHEHDHTYDDSCGA